jgi:hypothetical protein
MLDRVEQKTNRSEADSVVTNKTEWQTPSLTKLDVSQTQGGFGPDDEGSDGAVS